MIKKYSRIPDQSVLKDEENLFDYIDSFQAEISGEEQQCSMSCIMELFSSSGPQWAGKLMKIRDRIVQLFGLKTSLASEEYNKLDAIQYEVGKQYGIFELFYKIDNEFVLGENDKHLNFKVSLLLESIANSQDKKLSITTAVKFNNIWGKLYFLPVKPFHKLIVRKTVENIISKIEK